MEEEKEISFIYNIIGTIIAIPIIMAIIGLILSLIIVISVPLWAWVISFFIWLTG